MYKNILINFKKLLFYKVILFYPIFVFLTFFIPYGCSEENGILLKLSSDVALEKVEFYIKYYDEDNKTALIEKIEKTIPDDREGYFATKSNLVVEPLSIALKLPRGGYYAIHIVGYPKDSVEEAEDFYVASKCYSVSGVIHEDVIHLIGLTDQLDQDKDTVPDNLDDYCQMRRDAGLECEMECNTSEFLAAYDCDQNDPSINPFVQDRCGDEQDQDCWGGDETCVDRDEDGFSNNVDCNDNNPNINPSATEICGNGIDENCTEDKIGCTDGDMPCDKDGDNYYETLYQGCGNDCEDLDPGIHPEAAESCGSDNLGNGVDDDCDAFIDEGCLPQDLDNDGHPDKSQGGDDCNDCDPGINPSINDKLSSCSFPVDLNCDGVKPGCENGDNDHDWFVPPDDCDDNNTKIYPGASDVCGDGEAFNCIIDTICTSDQDSDNYNSSYDCDDLNPNLNPGVAQDFCEDLLDNNCNGITNEVWDYSGEDSNPLRGCIYDSVNVQYKSIDFLTDIQHCGECRHDCTTAAKNDSPIGNLCVDGLCRCGSNDRMCPGADPDNPGGDNDFWVCCLDADNEENSYCADLYHNDTDEARQDCGTCGELCDYGDGFKYGHDCIQGDCLCNSSDGFIEECNKEEGFECCRGLGCTELNTNIEHCGACDNDCNARQTRADRPLADRCVNGYCLCGENSACNNPQWCVNGQGCYDLDNDENNCGTIGHVCGPHSTCVVGNCVCDSPYLDCNGNGTGDDGNGCEKNSDIDSQNCGNCNRVCQGVNVSCIEGNCACGGADECPGETCCFSSYCADLNSDPDNCNACGNECEFLNATPSCNNGTCEYSCNNPYDDCDNDPGCETNLSNDVSNCGSCNNNCGQNTSCQSGDCNCVWHYDNCNNSWSDGCEKNLDNDVNNCGECNRVCSAQNTTANCISATCSYTCVSNYYNCNGAFSDGCECNTCCDGTSCLNPTGGKCCTASDCIRYASCSDHNCVCDSGHRNCDNDWSDGCDTDILNDVNNCGACNNYCGQNTYCQNGNCYCQTSYGNCNNDWSNGCEVDLRTNNNNCGTCGTKCGPNSSCIQGVCTCSAGWLDCNHSGIPTDADGCEINILEDESHCGSCTATCEAGVTCVNGNCACGAGGNCSTGSTCCFDSYCTNLNSDTNNCGTCGNVCRPGEECINGNCRCGSVHCASNQLCCSDDVCVTQGGTGLVGNDCCTNLESPICSTTYHTTCSSHDCVCSTNYYDCNADLNCDCSTCCNGTSCVSVGDGDVGDQCCGTCSSTKHTTCNNYSCSCSTGYYDCNADGSCDCSTCCNSTNCVVPGDGDPGDPCCGTCSSTKHTTCSSNSCVCETGYTLCGGSCHQNGTGTCCNNIWQTGTGLCCNNTWCAGATCCGASGCCSGTCCNGTCQTGIGLCCSNNWCAGATCCGASGCCSGECCNGTCETEAGTCCNNAWCTGECCNNTCETGAGICCSGSWYADANCCSSSDCSNPTICCCDTDNTCQTNGDCTGSCL